MSRRRKQTRNIEKVIQNLFRQIWNLAVTLTKSLINWLFRGLLVTRNQQRQASKAGFVLPTVTLLLLVVGLVIGAILFRTGSRTNQVISEREQQVIYNAATPAIDRARAKLEYLFTKDTRLPLGVPQEGLIESILLNRSDPEFSQLSPLSPNPYQLPDEEPLTLNGNQAAAWRFRVDKDGDGRNDGPNDAVVAYSIIFKARDPANPTQDPRLRPENIKANNLIVRNGPITSSQGVNPACLTRTEIRTSTGRTAPEVGWDLVNQATLRKTFQVTAVVSSSQNNNRTLTTLEFQQDREYARGNKWGAWFRYDLHLHPGPAFRWNGAMHTEGSLFLASNNENTASYLISSPDSCVYDPESNSVISVGFKTNPQTDEITFKGQVVNGRMIDNLTTGPRPQSVHIYKPRDPDDDSSNTLLTGNNDSVADGTGTPADIALDPVALFTNPPETQFRASTGDPTNESRSIQAWRGVEPKLRNDNGSFDNSRFTVTNEPPPYVDDTYRADDRYGPQPYYQTRPTPIRLDATRKNGTPIPPGTTELINNTPTPSLSVDQDLKTLGLDGYWERRAKVEGLRVIGGPRLELGNPNGWEGEGSGAPSCTTSNTSDDGDPLYPPLCRQMNTTSGNIDQTHQGLQRRTLRDNLSAVQATAIYHSADPSAPSPTGNDVFPIACLSTTAHAGTRQAVDRSKNFDRFGINTGEPIYANFFSGKGTNGWEYDPTPMRGLSGSWNTAIQNLANFAGDYQNANQSGAFPPTQGGRTFPYSYLTMWGNFSNLKRALSGDGNNSIADQSYKYSAACTMGILANSLVQIGRAVGITDFNNPNAAAALPANIASWDSRLDDLDNVTTPVSVEGYLLAAIPGTGTGERTEREQARLYALWEQIRRDRQLGFVQITVPSTPQPVGNPSNPTAPIYPADTNSPLAKYQYEVRYQSSFQFGGITYRAAITGNTNTEKRFLALSCDKNQLFSALSFPAGPTDTDQEKRFIRLAATLCSAGQPVADLYGRPKFPSLYYLFPFPAANGHNRDNTNFNEDNNEPYIEGTNNQVGDASFNSFNPADIALRPKNWGDWQTPTTTSGPSGTRPHPNLITDPNGNPAYVSFLDEIFFDGREQMPVRYLGIDLDLLRNNQVRGSSNFWLPTSGVIYAFREDAVREDGIARPANGTNPADARDPSNPRDPQLAPNGISRKPVDFYADPERRPYGFRFKNGADLTRALPLNDEQNRRGMTFISDNPVAILGNFNLHSTNGTENNLEEFTFRLNDPSGADGNFNPAQFYGRRANELDQRFARPDADRWRPAEILADSIALLSNSFVDGSIEEGIRGVRNISFSSLNAPTSNQVWLREDGSASNGTVASPFPTDVMIAPVKVSRNGNPLICNTPPNSNNTIITPGGNNILAQCPTAAADRTENTAYLPFTTEKRPWLNEATPTQFNGIFVSGVVPARNGQGNGGFHNFPRMLENWKDTVPLRIAGSFLQLNFSTYANAPFEHDAWEPGASPVSGTDATTQQVITYYMPPRRVWGYDVGLQLASAGPLSKRLTQSQPPRSEFYEELRANDPYVCNLRRVIAGQPQTESTQQVQQDCQS